ncbi:hypothetical protein RI367_004558 [Sorochytrium milnesiophthora]
MPSPLQQLQQQQQQQQQQILQQSHHPQRRQNHDAHGACLLASTFRVYVKACFMGQWKPRCFELTSVDAVFTIIQRNHAQGQVVCRFPVNASTTVKYRKYKSQTVVELRNASSSSSSSPSADSKSPRWFLRPSTREDAELWVSTIRDLVNKLRTVEVQVSNRASASVELANRLRNSQQLRASPALANAQLPTAVQQGLSAQDSARRLSDVARNSMQSFRAGATNTADRSLTLTAHTFDPATAGAARRPSQTSAAIAVHNGRKSPINPVLQQFPRSPDVSLSFDNTSNPSNSMRVSDTILQMNSLLDSLELQLQEQEAKHNASFTGNTSLTHSFPSSQRPGTPKSGPFANAAGQYPTPPASKKSSAASQVAPLLTDSSAFDEPHLRNAQHMSYSSNGTSAGDQSLDSISHPRARMLPPMMLPQSPPPTEPVPRANTSSPADTVQDAPPMRRPLTPAQQQQLAMVRRQLPLSEKRLPPIPASAGSEKHPPRTKTPDPNHPQQQRRLPPHQAQSPRLMQGTRHKLMAEGGSPRMPPPHVNNTSGLRPHRSSPVMRSYDQFMEPDDPRMSTMVSPRTSAGSDLQILLPRSRTPPNHVDSGPLPTRTPSPLAPAPQHQQQPATSAARRFPRNASLKQEIVREPAVPVAIPKTINTAEPPAPASRTTSMASTSSSNSYNRSGDSDAPMRGQSLLPSATSDNPQVDRLVQRHRRAYQQQHMAQIREESRDRRPEGQPTPPPSPSLQHAGKLDPRRFRSLDHLNRSIDDALPKDQRPASPAIRRRRQPETPLKPASDDTEDDDDDTGSIRLSYYQLHTLQRSADADPSTGGAYDTLLKQY